MYVSITLILLALAATVIVGLRLSRSSTSYFWITSALGALLTWISVVTWQLDLPQRFFPSNWTPAGLFPTSPILLADPYAWLYALSLAALAVAVILTSPARDASNLKPSSLAGTLSFTLLCVLAVLADNPLTLVLIWTAIDLIEFLNTLRLSDSPTLSERNVVSFAIRSVGTGFVLWGSVISAASAKTLLFENTTSQVGIYLILAVGLRLGALPLDLIYRSGPVLHREFGTVLHLMTAASSLILLARLPATALDSRHTTYLLIFVALAAVYCSLKWLTALNALKGKPYWIVGMSSLSLAASLCGNPMGSAAFGATLVLFGGISFLYSARNKWFTRFLAGLGIVLIALPFTITATSWNGFFPWPWFYGPIFFLAHFILVAGYVRHLFNPGECEYSELPSWAQTAYPIGLAFLIITALLAGLWGWPGARQTGLWPAAVSLAVMGVVSSIFVWRFQHLLGPISLSLVLPSPRVSFLDNLIKMLARTFWIIFRSISNISGLIADMLEGDGGLLWTLLLLVLIFTLLRGH